MTDTTPGYGKAEGSFLQFILRERRNKRLLYIVTIGTILQFTVFKLLYPFPDFFSDSWSYIYAASEKMDVNIWPIGYSKFLYLFHEVTHSALALNTFQYFSIILSSGYFYYTIIFFYSTSKYTRIILCLFLFFNPLNLYIANYVTSDAIFLSLSLLWIAQLIWILHRPRLYHVIFPACLVFVAFTFRYNAMCYPIIAAIAFILSKQALWRKLVGIAAGPVLIIPFILFSLKASKEMTGTAQFPPILGGWQWGNNALYMYEHIKVDSTRMRSPEVRELNRISKRFFEVTPPYERDLPVYVANYFIRETEAPLKQYLFQHYSFSTFHEQVVAWGKVSPVFKDFGLSLVKQHPVAFARYYLLVNTKNYFFPPLEKLEIYNLGLDEVPDFVQHWFQFKSPKIWAISKPFQGILLFLYPYLFFAFNLYFAWGYLQFIRPKHFKTSSPHFRYCCLVIGAFVLLNFGFSVFANIIVIRYQVFPMIICLAFSLLLIDAMKLLEDKKTPVPVQ